jgi:CheY-like chemotaxis protein
MKVEALCPDCDGGYLVEIEALEAGLPCPGCGRRLGRPGGAAGPAVEPEARGDIDRPAEVETVPSMETQTAIEAPAPAEAVAAPTGARAAVEVVCPRCNLHFKPRAQTQAQVRGTASRPTILVVEDMEYFREIAAEALAGEYEVRAVATKDEARSALAGGGIDLMVLDLTLDGGEGGLDLLHELERKPCPVLIYTAQDESEMYGDQWDQLKRLGADDIVIKGLSVGDELIRKVGSLLGRIDDDNE